MKTSRDRLTSFIEGASLAMAMFDRAMCYLAVSRRWRRDFSMGEGDLTGRSHYDMFPEISEAWKEVHRRGLAGENIGADEDRFVRKDGSTQWLRWEVTPWRGEDGSVGGIIIFSEDITERKELELALRKTAESLEQLVSARTAELMEAQRLAHTGSWTWDPEHDVVWWSPEFSRIVGLEWTEHPPSAKEQKKLYSPETYDRMMVAVENLIRTGEPYEVPLDVVRPDGSIRHCIARGERMKDRPGWLRGTMSDVTEIRRLEAEKAELESHKQRLYKSESLGRLAGAVAHHFNNNLMAVMGNLELALTALSENDSRDHELPGFLAEAMQSARKGAEISRMMLAYLGQRPIHRTRVDLSAACASGIALLRVGVPADVVIIPRLPDSGPMLSADPALIQEVLAILLVNAWEATGKERNIIQVRVSLVAAEEIPAAWRAPVTFTPAAGRYACLEVSDTGTGISPDAMMVLFDPFYSTKFTGRGLGLPAVLGIVQMHKGVVTVESRPGKGSTFRVFLPATSDA